SVVIRTATSTSYCLGPTALSSSKPWPDNDAYVPCALSFVSLPPVLSRILRLALSSTGRLHRLDWLQRRSTRCLSRLLPLFVLGGVGRNRRLLIDTTHPQRERGAEHADRFTDGFNHKEGRGRPQPSLRRPDSGRARGNGAWLCSSFLDSGRSYRFSAIARDSSEIASEERDRSCVRIEGTSAAVSRQPIVEELPPGSP
ncbi:hypothetical protein ABIB83_009057, partial [Bradyrhizobium sp. I1.8.5]